MDSHLNEHSPSKMDLQTVDDVVTLDDIQTLTNSQFLNELTKSNVSCVEFSPNYFHSRSYLMHCIVLIADVMPIFGYPCS